jgi:hypothetical protein
VSEPGRCPGAGRRSLLGDANRERLIVLLREYYAAVGWIWTTRVTGSV